MIQAQPPARNGVSTLSSISISNVYENHDGTAGGEDDQRADCPLIGKVGRILGRKTCPTPTRIAVLAGLVLG